MKAIRLLLLGSLLLLQTGCWNRVELNDIAIISATGVDWENGKWVLTNQIVIPKAISGQAGGGRTAAVNVFSSTGDNFRIAISKASQESSRRLYFSHNQIVIIGQEAARKGVGPLLEAYLRNHDSRETVDVFLSKGTARLMLEQLIPLEQIPGAAIQRMIVNEEMSSSSYRQMTIHHVLMDLLGHTKATSIPGLALAGSGESTDRVDMLSQTSTPSKVRLSELGLVYGDKLVGWIGEEQSKGVMWLTNHVDKTTVAFACTAGGKGRQGSSARVLHSVTKVKPQQQDGKWVMKVNIEAQGTLLEYDCGGDLMKPEEIWEVERLVEERIASIVTDGWEVVRKHKVDVLGFGTLIYKHHPKTWKVIERNWKEEFPQTEIELNVNMKLSSTGMSGKSFKEAQKKPGL
ncbi:Ger(x)C family spore germination protein [Paenibacillus paeoniae]|uniref:Ger(X)C family spore germination protein n=1 Tax=Paenibacillus paeoniae TaxID=2292705 RepID=A0A371PKY7_9BACL|nr:Ger(x)C family spore germination protein [Paenibacillus paeoniae]REK76437.1 Ger(x)C family spore germination protein [Paenibacillus paeoniae]